MLSCYSSYMQQVILSSSTRLGVWKHIVEKLKIDAFEKFNIPYDDLIFGKTHSYLYIDENTVHAQMDTFNDLGWLRGGYMDVAGGYWEEKGSEDPEYDMNKFVKPRLFNDIMKVVETVIKYEPHKMMCGEIYFYHHVLSELCEYFSALVHNPGENCCFDENIHQRLLKKS